MKEIFTALIMAVCATASCSSVRTQSASVTEVPSAQPLVSVEAASQPAAPIRSIDFRNFTYPWPEDLRGEQPTFTLTNGEMPEKRNERGLVDGMGIYWSDIAYGDATGDGHEDAIVSLSVLTGGSSVPHLIYVFTDKAGETLLLWHFATGDRADGGLRRIYADSGKLVVEINSPTKSNGDCCPTQFLRRQYKWNGKSFLKSGETILPVP